MKSMQPSSSFRQLVRTSLQLAFASAVAIHWGCDVSTSFAQEGPAAAPPAQAEPAKGNKQKKINAEKVDERRTEKDKAFKAEKLDTAQIEPFYKETLIPSLTSKNPDVINKARKEIVTDIEYLETKSKGKPDVIAPLNTMLLPMLRELAIRDKDGAVYSDTARINAVVLLGRLNSRAGLSSDPTPIPDFQAQKVLIPLIDRKETNDGVVSAAISGTTRYLRFAPESADTTNVRKAFLKNVEQFLAGPKPALRGQETDDYLKEQIIEALTLIAVKEGDVGKQASLLLAPLVNKSIIESKSEWLIEKSLASLGQAKPIDPKPEDIAALKIGTVKFILSSMTSWKKKCDSTSSSVTASAYPGSSRGAGPGVGAGGGMMGEGPSGPPGAGGSAGKDPKEEKKEKQPPEVRNARRMLQQRLEKVHMALNGYGKKSNDGASSTKGLIGLVAEDEKESLGQVIDAVEKLQQALNDEKISDIDKLLSTTKKTVKDLTTACTAIVGESADDKDKEKDKAEESNEAETTAPDDAFGSN